MFLGGSFEVNFNAPRLQEHPFKFMLNVGAGVMKMKVDDTFDAGHPANGFDHTYPTIQGGAKIGYQVEPWLNLFVNGTAYLVIIKSGDTSVFPIPDTFDHAWVFPVTAGVRLTFLRLSVGATQRREGTGNEPHPTDPSGRTGPPR